MSKRLVLFGEGQGDVAALPVLVDRLLAEKQAWDALVLDRRPPFKVGNANQMVKCDRRTGVVDSSRWTGFLRSAGKRSNVGAILVVLDGDIETFAAERGKRFCAWSAARWMATKARDEVGAGTVFSLAIVFACQEYESWFLAGWESFAGAGAGSGMYVAKPGASAPPPEPETAPRDAAGWLRNNLVGSYRKDIDQARISGLVDTGAISVRMRSFRRLEHAVTELVEAIRTRKHICTPQ